jgi:membrane-bound lytic murein transglycosylase D
MIRFLIIISLMIFAVSCAGVNTAVDKSSQTPAEAVAAILESDLPDPTESGPMEDFDPEFISGGLQERWVNYALAKKDPKYHFNNVIQQRYNYDIIPLVENSRYKYYVKRFTEDIPNVFQKWLERSNKYIYIVKDILRREGVPDELAYLPFTESGFNPTAVSRAGASGMWQFMRGTGKVYDLNDDYWVDERRDFEKATIAAARHFRELYEDLDDWYLAMAAYNAGMGKILRAIKRYDSKDFYTLSRYPYLKQETKDYVPKYMALRHIFCNYQDYGFETPVETPLIFDRITLDKQANLFVIAKLTGTDIDTLRDLNPELKKPMTPPVKSYSLRVPYGTAEVLETQIASMTQDELLQYRIYNARRGQSIDSIAKKYGVSTSELKAANGFTYNKILLDTPVFIPVKKYYDKELNAEFVKDLKRYNPRVHIVRKGDNMYNIAHKYGLSLSELMSMNRNVNPRLIKPGQGIIVSVDYKRSDKRYVKKDYKKYDTVKKSGKKITHVVRSGDSLWAIAQRYGTTVSEIKKTNKLSGSQIIPGKVLVIYD